MGGGDYVSCNGELCVDICEKCNGTCLLLRASSYVRSSQWSTKVEKCILSCPRVLLRHKEKNALC